LLQLLRVISLFRNVFEIGHFEDVFTVDALMCNTKEKRLQKRRSLMQACRFSECYLGMKNSREKRIKKKALPKNAF
jgi:hypothetical protein